METNFYAAFTNETEYLGEIDEGSRVRVALANLDEDAFMEMVIGNFRGGLSAFSSDIIFGTPTSDREELGDFGITSFRNPSRDYFILKGAEDIMRNTVLEIYDPSGKLVKRQLLQSGQEMIRTENMTKGVYFLKFTNERGTDIRRVIKAAN